MPRFPLLLMVLIMNATSLASDPVLSELWGTAGERWSPASRLPDFSYAGYRCGEAPLPTAFTEGVDIKRYGAVGDGETDDTAAFLAALADPAAKVIHVPAGRYRITAILEITRQVVIRGAGPDQTVLFFPTPLQEIRPNWGATTGGQKTSNYSWSGGMIWIKGDLGQKELATITAPAKRGQRVLQLSATQGISPGDWVCLRLTDEPGDSLAAELYDGDPADLSELKGRVQTSLISRVTAVRDGAIELERALRCDVDLSWKPTLLTFAPSVEEVGVEGLAFEFPVTSYAGHFTEMGYNALAMSNVANCWARNLRVVNADSGFFIGGHFNTIADVVYQSSRPPDKAGSIGHHGVYVGGSDNLFTRFDFQVSFIHDLSVSRCVGNVFSEGRGVNLCLDHHKFAPYENLFTNVDAGRGSRLWKSGGGANLGKHAAARCTYWNIRATNPMPYPAPNFGPWSLNIVGLYTQQPGSIAPDARWHESIDPSRLQPANLHLAQLQRRLSHSADLQRDQ